MDAPAGEAIAAGPDIDENGVDLAQIRALLALSPAERLERVSAFMSSLTALREPQARTQPDSTRSRKNSRASRYASSRESRGPAVQCTEFVVVGEAIAPRPSADVELSQCSRSRERTGRHNPCGWWRPLALTVAPLVIALAAIAACVVPVRRATNVSPLEALRAE